METETSWSVVRHADPMINEAVCIVILLQEIKRRLKRLELQYHMLHKMLRTLNYYF